MKNNFSRFNPYSFKNTTANILDNSIAYKHGNILPFYRENNRYIQQPLNTDLQLDEYKNNRPISSEDEFQGYSLNFESDSSLKKLNAGISVDKESIDSSTRRFIYTDNDSVDSEYYLLPQQINNRNYIYSTNKIYSPNRGYISGKNGSDTPQNFSFTNVDIKNSINKSKKSKSMIY
jgi:hypothetical protein